MAGVTALGQDWPSIRSAFAAGRTGVRFMAEWSRFSGINTRLAMDNLGLSLTHQGEHADYV